MKIRYVFFLIFTFYISKTAYAAEAFVAKQLEETMCHKKEDIYFSCTVGKMILSICALANDSPNNGYVQYRFGRPDKVEFKYPRKLIPPNDLLVFSDLAEGSFSTSLIKFRPAAYTYLVFDSAVSGVYVKKGGRTIRHLLCDGGQYSHMNPLTKRGIKTAEPDNTD